MSPDPVDLPNRLDSVSMQWKLPISRLRKAKCMYVLNRFDFRVRSKNEASVDVAIIRKYVRPIFMHVNLDTQNDALATLFKVQRFRLTKESYYRVAFHSCNCNLLCQLNAQ